MQLKNSISLRPDADAHVLAIPAHYSTTAPDGGLFHGGALREGWYKKFVHDLAQRDTMFPDLHIEIPSGRIPIQEEKAWAYMYFCMRAGQIHHAQLVYDQELTWDMDVSEKQKLWEALQQYGNLRQSFFGLRPFLAHFLATLSHPAV